MRVAAALDAKHGLEEVGIHARHRPGVTWKSADVLKALELLGRHLNFLRLARF
jgi:hypothetical protein